LHEDGEDASTLIDSRIDDPSDDIDGDALDDTFAEFAEDAIEETSDAPLYEQFERDDEVLNPPPYEPEVVEDDFDGLDEEWNEVDECEDDVGYYEDGLDDDLEDELEDEFDDELEDDFENDDFEDEDEDDPEDDDLDDDDLDDFDDAHADAPFVHDDDDFSDHD